MKRCALLPLSLLLLSGCAQVFNGNLFHTIDKPAPVDTSSVSSMESAAKANPKSFYTAFQGNPSGLAAAQTTLATAFSASAVAAATTAAAQAAVVDAAQTYVLTTAFSTNVGTVSNGAVQQLSNLSSNTSSSVTAAVSGLFAGQSQAQVQATLDQYVNISNALSAMQSVSSTGTGNTVDSSTFLGPTTNGDFVQTALVAGTVSALLNGTPAMTTAQLATALSTGKGIPTPSSSFQDAINNPQPASNPYAYMYTLQTALKPN